MIYSPQTNKKVWGDFILTKKFKFRYSKKEVEDIISDYENLIDIQKRDIEYLKKDNAELRSSLFELSAEIAYLEQAKK